MVSNQFSINYGVIKIGGKMKHLISFGWAIMFCSISVFAEVNADSCDYYDQLESRMECGVDGYIQQFAKPYCKSYLSKSERFTLRSQQILREIRLCLQTMLAKAGENVSCTELESYGFASHEYCYLVSGFCEMNSIDKMQVLWVARNEILDPRILASMLKLNRTCMLYF
jgi:hypothetical protein